MRPEWRDIQPRPCGRCGGTGKLMEPLVTGGGLICRTCRGSGRLYIDVGRWNYRKFHPADNEPSYSP